MKYKDYKELNVWKKSITLVKLVYPLIQQLPQTEKFALCDQMRRAAISIPSNIAEGKARTSGKEFRHFLEIAQGSRAELETQLIICEELGYLSHEQIAPALLLSDELRKMLFVFIENVQY